MKLYLAPSMAIAISFIVLGFGNGCIGSKGGLFRSARTTEDEVKMQTICPVMGVAVNKDIFVDADGKRIYLCCEGCVEAVKADPQKYIEKIEAEGFTLEKTPVEKTPDELRREKQEAKRPI